MRRRREAHTSSGRTERHKAVADLLAAAPAALSSLAGYVPAMTNAFGVVLDSASVRRAAVEGVPETVIAAVRLLHKKSVDEVASKLRPDELGHVIRLVGRCPSCYPPGTLDALKARSHARSPERPSASTPTKPAAKGQTGHTTRADHPRRLETRTPIGVAHGANARQSPFERANGADGTEAWKRE
jgi:hypothetical protein